ncbi:F-box protein SKIP23-like [Carex rostrata]
MAFRDWAHLPTVAVQLISEKVKSITDFVRFRAVCLPWRSASLPQPHHLPPQLSWLMIPYYPDPEHNRKDDGIRLFYDLWQSKMHKLHLPETSGKMCCASYRGWLVLVATQGTEVFLLNPLTRARIHLPPFTTPVKVFGVDKEDCQFEASYWFEPYIGNFVISKLSFSTNLTDPNCLIMVFLQRTSRTFFCRVGDTCWTMVNMQPREIRTAAFADATYHDGRFYLLSHEGVLRVYHLNDPGRRLVCSFPQELQSVTKILLEGKSGVYMVVVHQTESEDRGEEEVAQEDQDDLSDETKEGTEEGPKQKIELYQFLEQSLGIRQITDTSNTTIFYGDNHHCLAVCSDDWDLLRGGCMYMEYVCAPSASKDKGEACYGIYFTKLDDGKSKLVVHDLGESPRLWPTAPAMWFQPSFV